MSLKMRITLFGPPILGTFIDAIVSSFWETSWENLLVELLLVWKELSILVIGVQRKVNFMNENDNMDKIDNMDDTMYHINEIIFMD